MARGITRVRTSCHAAYHRAGRWAAAVSEVDCRAEASGPASASEVAGGGQAPAVLAAKAVNIKAEANSSKPLNCQETIVCPRACIDSIDRTAIAASGRFAAPLRRQQTCVARVCFKAMSAPTTRL